MVLCRDPSDLAVHAVLASDRRPDVLVVDDAHLLQADGAERLWRHVATDGLVVVATVRSGEVMPDGVARLWTGGLCERLDLRPLTEPDVQTLLVAVLGGDVEDRLSLAVYRGTEGNPLLVREIVRVARRSGAIGRDHEVWRLAGPLPVDAGISELIGSRLGILDAGERNAAELIALGEPLPLVVAEGIVGCTVLEALEVQGIIHTQDSVDGVVVTLAHPLYGEVIRSTLAPLRTRRLQQALVAAIEGGEHGGRIAVRATLWRLELGIPPDPAELLDAARVARSIGAGAAERLARAAVAAERSIGAVILLAEILVQQGRVNEVDRLLDDLDNDSLDAQSLTALVAVRALARIRLGELAEASSIVATATESLDPTRLQALYANAETLAGRPGESAPIARAIVADEEATAGSRCIAGMALVAGGALAGRNDEAEEVATAARRLFDEVRRELPFVPSSMQVAGLIATTAAGRLELADRAARQLYESALEGDDEWLRPRGASALGVVALARGLVRSATRYFRITVASLNDFDLLFLRYNVAWLARAAAAAGFEDEASGAMQQAADAPVCGLFEIDWLIAEAAVLAARGLVHRAIDQALDAARQGAAAGLWGVASTAAFDALRYGGGVVAAELVMGAVERVDGPLPMLLGAAASAVALDDPAALDDASCALESLGTLLFAADIAHAAANSHRRAGDPRAAVRAVARSRALAAQCEGARRPWAVDAGVVGGLTGREQEVAILAAAGRSDAELAAELSISIRTVQSHLARTYMKLGVSGRRDLAEALIEAVPSRPPTS